MGGSGSKSSPKEGVVVESKNTNIDQPREAVINSGKDCQTGIEVEGRTQQFETGNQRLISLVNF